jgi:hypothetical protein
LKGWIPGGEENKNKTGKIEGLDSKRERKIKHERLDSNKKSECSRRVGS